MSRLREEEMGSMSRLREEEMGSMSRLREEQMVAMRSPVASAGTEAEVRR
jgi:hypothetical protein